MRLRRGSAATFALSVSIQRKEQSNETHEGTDQGKAGRARARASARLPCAQAHAYPGDAPVYPRGQRGATPQPARFNPRGYSGPDPRGSTAAPLTAAAAHTVFGDWRAITWTSGRPFCRLAHALHKPCPRFSEVLPTLWRSLAHALARSLEMHLQNGERAAVAGRGESVI